MVEQSTIVRIRLHLIIYDASTVLMPDFAPSSGPKRYDYSNDDQHWFYTRDGSFLLKLLEEELSEKLGTKVSFEA